MRASSALPPKHLYRRTNDARSLAWRLHWLDLRNRGAGKFRRRPKNTRRQRQSRSALYRPPLFHRERDPRLYEALHPAGFVHDRDNGKRRGPHAPFTRSRCEGADLFYAGGDRHPERPRNLGRLRRPHLQTAADALSGTVLRLKSKKTPNAQRPTPNIEFRILHSALDVRRWAYDVFSPCPTKPSWL